MKTIISTLAMALALAFTGPAFAGDVALKNCLAERLIALI
jgi:hypothetical protein